jgi:hypothetical protein
LTRRSTICNAWFTVSSRNWTTVAGACRRPRPRAIVVRFRGARTERAVLLGRHAAHGERVGRRRNTADGMLAVFTARTADRRWSASRDAAHRRSARA